MDSPVGYYPNRGGLLDKYIAKKRVKSETWNKAFT